MTDDDIANQAAEVEAALKKSTGQPSDGWTSKEFAAAMAKKGWTPTRSEHFLTEACARGIMDGTGVKPVPNRTGRMRQTPVYKFVAAKKAKGKR